MGGLAGYYECSYSFRADDSIKAMYPWIILSMSNSEGLKTYLFEIRTSFKLRGIDGQITELGWERFGSGTSECDADRAGITFLENETTYRLQGDYGMSDGEFRSWARAALAFAKQTQLAADSSSKEEVIAVVVGLDVLTVQQEGEPMEAAKERAIKTESLIPISLWPEVPICSMSNNMGIEEGRVSNEIRKKYRLFFLFLPKIRVEDEEAVKELTCAVCLREKSFAKGTQISFIPNCNHPVHPRCLFERLRDWKTRCPSCSARIPDDKQIDDWDQFGSTPSLLITE